ncbi:MAG: T9SS type A sorting domain-containing protein [Candidatus Azobacteroides sp.]|nr:T9SS type A sorting domain-containing protein [Candidatus Azobacteroides sp.]
MKKVVLFAIMLFVYVLLHSQDYYTTGPNVYTCKNGVIETMKPNRELNSQELEDIDYNLFNPNGAYFSLGITKSDIISAPTTYYNCHAYAWYLTEGNTNKVWINQITQSGGNNLSKFWDQNVGCFVETTSEASADKIFYYSGDHSAVKSSVAGKYESKWGSWYVIRHNPNSVPYFNPGNRTYYVKIPNITGPSFVCYGSNATFTLNNVPNLATTTSWSVSVPVTIVSQSNNSVTVSPTSPEPFTADLTAEMYQNGNLISTTVKTLSVNMANFNINGPSVILALQSGSYTANASPSSCTLPSTGLNYEWRINGALVETSPNVAIQSVQGSTLSAMSTNVDSKSKMVLSGDSMTTNQLITTPINNIDLSVTIKNSSGKLLGSTSMQVTIYGDYQVISKALSPPAPIAMNVYPNPASGILNIETGEDGNTPSAAKQHTTTLDKPLKTDITREVRLYDGHGKLLLHTKTKDSHVHLNVSHLHNGIYYLHIYNGVSDKPEIHQIMVKH